MPLSAAAQGGRMLFVDTCRNKEAAIDELELFPYGPKDDMVDALSGAFNYFRSPVIMSSPKSLRKGAGSYWNQAMRGVGSTYGY
jgi:hypothetical protein